MVIGSLIAQRSPGGTTPRTPRGRPDEEPIISGLQSAATLRNAVSALVNCGPVRLSPVTTTSAGAGPPGNAVRTWSRVRTTGTLSGNDAMPGSCRCKVASGVARASSATAARPPSARGRRVTAVTTARQVRDGLAVACLRPRNGTRARSVALPSSESSAGRKVSEPRTAMATTSMVPMATPSNTWNPVTNSPAMHAITVRPAATMARPEVRAAVPSASAVVAPAARSSRTRRR